MRSFAERRFILPLSVLAVFAAAMAAAGFPPEVARAQSAGQGPPSQQDREPGAEAQSVDDFESYDTGQAPEAWKFVSSDKELVPLREEMDQSQRFYIVQEDKNKFLRGYTRGEALRISKRNGKEFDWSLEKRPYLRWEWRAHQLPEGASEKGANDTGAAVYVTFGSDWLGRPKSIKYTYSSTLPVGTAVDFGPLKALVVASGAEVTGRWLTETRDVARDYRSLFGEAPPRDAPVSITLWSDSDSTGGTAEVDFDDLRLLSEL